nr:hypothetical protein [Actinomycetota bacterium]
MVDADAYEPDNHPPEAAAFEVAEVQLHNFHQAGDEDWVRFYAVPGFAYEIEAEQLGTNSDLALEIYYEEPNGTVTLLPDLAADDDGKGEGAFEFTFLDFLSDPGLQPGMYHVRVSSADTTCWGVGSEYELSVYVSVGAGQLIVIAADKLNPGAPPAGATAMVDGTNVQAFGSSVTVTYQNLAPGIHTVEVTTAAGYLSDEDPASPDQVGNPDSVLYGNPKDKQVVDLAWQSVAFQFVPAGRAEGVVRDGWTGEFIGGAGLSFR